jgi:hypothetical protein
VEEFGDWINEIENSAVKLPDINGRFMAFLNVLGLNPIARPIDEGRGETIPDPYFIIRRKIIGQQISNINPMQVGIIAEQVPAAATLRSNNTIPVRLPGLWKSMKKT